MSKRRDSLSEQLKGETSRYKKHVAAQKRWEREEKKADRMSGAEWDKKNKDLYKGILSTRSKLSAAEKARFELRGHKDMRK